jgi:Domain of unknown function (DUF1707)
MAPVQQEVWMVTRQELRASDREREQVVETLKDQTALGRLSLEELEERSGAAYAARTRVELQQLTEDLPLQVAAHPQGPARRPDWLAVLVCCWGLPRRWRP